jgi:hypothetical protein
MSLNPKLRKDSSNVWWLDWTTDPAAIAYDIITSKGQHVQAGKNATSVKLGALTEPFTLPQIAPGVPTDYETPPDPFTPTIKVTSSIANGATVDNAITWEATVEGGLPDPVEFYVDGALKTTEHKAPYRYGGDTGLFDPNTLNDGLHTLNIVAKFADGKQAGWTGQVTTKKAATPPPSTGTKFFGICPPWPLQASLQSQLDLAKQCGLVSWPRIAGGDANAQTVQAAGFTRWTVYLGITNWPSNQEVIDYAKKYPGALIECCNEANLHNVYTAQQTADFHKQLYAAMKAAGVEKQLMLSSVGNSSSGVEHLLPLDWCKRLAAAGCKAGTGFTVANYHMYSVDPDGYNNWMHVWGTDSCQTVFGNPPYIITEFGCKTSDDNTQVQAVKNWVAKIKTLDNCMGGQWFCMLDNNWSGFGLVRTDGSHRPAFDTFRQVI